MSRRPLMQDLFRAMRFRRHRPEDSFGFTREETARIMEPIYDRADRLMTLFILGHFVVAVAQALFYGTWLITLVVGSAATAMFLLSRFMLPRHQVTRMVAGIALQSFVALHIYQLHGLPEMHFFFFTAFTMMIIYQDWLSMWPGALLVIGQHILFAVLQNSGSRLYIFPDAYVGFTRHFFHFGVALAQVGICSSWAVILRRQTLESAAQRRQILQSQNDLRELNAGLEERVRDRTAKLAIALEKTQELDQFKTQFFANVSHELRTPLALILGPVERAIGAARADSRQRHDLEGVLRNAQLLLRHVNDLLDVAKLEAGRMQAHFAVSDLARLTRLVGSNFDDLAEERRVAFSIEAPDTLDGEVDPEKFQRILMNLLSNAFKFTPAGGRVRCVLEVDRPPDANDGTRTVSVTVADSGPGIPEAQRESVFERFRQLEGPNTRRFGGTGLGLVIVRDFAGLHRGTVAVDAAPEGGALFRVTLPLQAPPEAAVKPRDATFVPVDAEAIIGELRRPAPPATTAAPLDGRALALVVEDNPVMSQFIAETLAPEYRVITALHGRDGLRMAEARSPDIILTDFMMPEMSGEQLVVALRARRQFDRVPIVLLSARADDDLRTRLLNQGVQDYIVKPFLAEELRARVRNLVRARQLSEREREELLEELGTLNADLENRILARTKALRESLEEREVLLQEVHHRVKNNLQVISSLIDMQAHRLPDGTGREALEECQARVRVMALIHETIYQSKTYSGIPFSDYARRLADNVFAAADVAPNAVVLDLAIEDGVVLSVDKAIPCGLLLNELITNARKHAFPNGREGTVRVDLVRMPGGQVRLVVEDNGVGLPATMKLPTEQSLGLQLIGTLSRQLGGTLDIVRDGGTAFQVTFSASERQDPAESVPSAA